MERRALTILSYGRNLPNEENFIRVFILTTTRAKIKQRDLFVVSRYQDKDFLPTSHNQDECGFQ